MYDWGLTDDDLAQEFHDLISQLPHRSYRHAVGMIARQVALKIAGPSWQEYFEAHRHRLLEDAAKVIATSPRFVRYRVADPLGP
jgi:hypothetical protein